MIIGAILILVVMLPNIRDSIAARRAVEAQRQKSV